MGLMSWNDVKVFCVHPYFEHNYVQPLLTKIAVTVTLGLAVHHGVRYYQRRAYEKRRAAYKKDVVILHQFDRARRLPNISPYCLKLETYLRLANIPYENDFRDPMGPLGKSPWITYNGHDVTDSRLCIEYLNDKFNVNLNSNLSVQEVAIGHMVVLTLESHTAWIMARHRWIYADYKDVAALMNFDFIWPMPFWLLYRMIGKQVDARTRAIGIGLHTRETIDKFGHEDMKQLSAYLGQNKYLFGDKVSEYDCSLFGFVSMVAWGITGSKFEQWINEEFQNLKDYALRMKELSWPDWESCITN